MLYFSGQRKKAGHIIIICAAGILLLYILPFFINDTGIFVKGYEYHTKAALSEWQGQSWQQPGEKPYQLFTGIGFAGMFYDYYKGSVEEKLRAFQILHVVLCAAIVLFSAIFFFIKRHKVLFTAFALGTLKIYLSVFYHFIQIPYDYLYLTLIYVSIPVVWLSMKPQQHETSHQHKS